MNRLGIKSFSKTAGITTAGITLVAVFTGGLMPDKVNALEETFFGFVTDGNNYTILNVPESLETSAGSISFMQVSNYTYAYNSFLARLSK